MLRDPFSDLERTISVWLVDIITDQLGRHRPAALSKGTVKSDRLYLNLPRYRSSCVIPLVSLTQQ